MKSEANMSVLDLLVIIFGLVAIYGVWRYAKIEENDYKKVVELHKNTVTDVTDLREQLKRAIESNEEIKVEVYDFRTRVEQLTQEVDQFQEHMAKLRMSYINLRERVMPRKVQVIGPIPVEIHQPKESKTEKKLKSIKKQIDGLSK